MGGMGGCGMSVSGSVAHRPAGKYLRNRTELGKERRSCLDTGVGEIYIG